MKAGNMWWAMHVICTEEKGNAYRISEEILNKGVHLEVLCGWIILN
jgi:hypothetical protein